MTFNSPFPPPMTQGSDAKMKAMGLEHRKNMPPPTAGANQPVRYGTTPAQDKMQQSLQLLGAGQQFPNQPPTGE